jgi:hypothetical protein
MAAPQAEGELAIGFFGSRYERATPAEREYLRAIADLLEQGRGPAADGSAADGAAAVPEAAVATAAIAELLQRRPQSLSPARDALIKKGLVYSGERGLIAFTVPHFDRYLRAHPAG